MKMLLSSALGLAAVVSTLASPFEDGVLFDRATNEKCSVAEGTGVCESTITCKGISSPSDSCPQDASNSQCCVEIPCSAPGVGSGFYRSVAKNDCEGGKFESSIHLPDDEDTVCCIEGVKDDSEEEMDADKMAEKDASEVVKRDASPLEARGACSAARFNRLMYGSSIGTFFRAKRSRSPSCFNWSSNGCTGVSDTPGGYNFNPSCQRHDFGYRNAKKFGWFTGAVRKVLDTKFKEDMYAECNKVSGAKREDCRRLARWYYRGVRSLGWIVKQ